MQEIKARPHHNMPLRCPFAARPAFVELRGHFQVPAHVAKLGWAPADASEVSGIAMSRASAAIAALSRDGLSGIPSSSAANPH